MKPLSLTEIFGVSPFAERASEALFALKGDGYTKGSKYGLSSLGIFNPKLSIKTWLGKRLPDGALPVVNLFNHTQTPISEGWSVRKTQVRDFRGKSLTYDSHNGTDFAIPPGTVVVSSAKGKVLHISREFHRGGLKIFIDHGDGLFVSYNHLGRSLVRVGDEVERGAPIALSAYSGLDGLVSFPWGAPHVHYNVWLNGVYVDPFAREGEVSLWLHGNDPKPPESLPSGDDYVPTAFDAALVSEWISACKKREERERLHSIAELPKKAMALHVAKSYFPLMFEEGLDANLSRTKETRKPKLTLPFAASEFKKIVFADEL